MSININNADRLKMPVEKGNTQELPIDKYISNLIEFGVVSKEQGDLIRQNLAQAGAAAHPPMQTMDKKATPANNAEMIDFKVVQEHKKFLEDRGVLKEYLENAGVELDKTEFEKIYNIVCELENAAVERFKQVAPEGGNLKQANSEALSRLNTASARGLKGGFDVVKRFTLDEIGKMSPAEFKKNEALINQQLREGTL